MTQASQTYRWRIIGTFADPRATVKMTAEVEAQEWWQAVEEIDVNDPAWTEGIAEVTIRRVSEVSNT